MVDPARALSLCACPPSDGLALMAPGLAMAPSGREVACWFCPECGSRIYHSSLLGPGYWHLKPGTLDDTGWLDPVAEVWAQSAQPSLRFSDRLMSFAWEPDDIPAMRALWQSRKAGARKTDE
jgi:hypothetical protein